MKSFVIGYLNNSTQEKGFWEGIGHGLLVLLKAIYVEFFTIGIYTIWNSPKKAADANPEVGWFFWIMIFLICAFLILLWLVGQVFIIIGIIILLAIAVAIIVGALAIVFYLPLRIFLGSFADDIYVGLWNWIKKIVWRFKKHTRKFIHRKKTIKKLLPDYQKNLEFLNQYLKKPLTLKKAPWPRFRFGFYQKYNELSLKLQQIKETNLAITKYRKPNYLSEEYDFYFLIKKNNLIDYSSKSYYSNYFKNYEENEYEFILKSKDLKLIKKKLKSDVDFYNIKTPLDEQIKTLHILYNNSYEIDHGERFAKNKSFYDFLILNQWSFR